MINYMTEFNKTSFEQLMDSGVALHISGDYIAAVDFAREAYDIAPDNTLEKGRAARDIGVRLQKLGDVENSELWAHKAYDIHDQILTGTDENISRDAYRERAVSSMYLALHGLHRVLASSSESTDVNISNDPLVLMRQAWNDLGIAKSKSHGLNACIDQYEINAVRRVSVAETILGDRKKGLRMGVRGLMLAAMSESPLLNTSTPGLSVKERIRAKTKAFAGSTAALATGVLFSQKQGRSRNAASKKLSLRAL